MRVAQVITLYLPEFVGGATLACARLAHALAARGHELAIFCGRPDPDAPLYGERGWAVDGIPVTGVAVAPGYAVLDRRNYWHPEVTPVFERFLERTRPDVVHFHSVQALGGSLLAAAAARDLPVVVTLHDWWWWCVRLFVVDPEGFVCPPRVDSARCHCAPASDLVGRRAVLDAALAHADRVLAPSRFLAQAAIANGVPARRVAVCANGVPRSARPARHRPGPVRFGYFGGPDNRLKGLPTLVAAADALDVGGWELVLHGVAPDAMRVPLAIADRVRRRPPFPPAQLAAVLGELDCLVVPSLMRESYSLVTREALAAGVPALASDSGGPAEVVASGVNGFVFATGDPGDLANRMRRLVLDPALLERVRAGAAATPIATVEDQAVALERVYGELRAARSRVGGARSDRPPAGALHHVLFVTGIDGAPLRYRVINLQDQLRLQGVTSAVLYYTDPAIPAAIAANDLVVLYRVPMDPYVEAYVALARRLGRPLLFSCDDLVFDADATPSDALALLPAPHRDGWRAYTRRYAATLAACDGFLGSTEPLVAAAARAGVRGAVARNGLGTAQLAIAEEMRKRRWRGARHASSRAARPEPARVLRVAYASGSLMHDLDFALVEPALAAVLRRVPGSRLRLIGPLHTGPALEPFRDRVERVPFVPWQELFARLAEVDVVLAPLRDDPFSDAKSEVKFLEAAALGIPTIASPTSAFRHAIRDGENGLLAATGDAWREALLRVLADAGLRHRLGNAARDRAFLAYTPAAQADALLAALDELRRPSAAVSSASRRDDPRAPWEVDHPLAPARGDSPSATGIAPGALAAAFPGVGRFDLEPEDASAGAAQLARDTPSPFLVGARTVGQCFHAAADHLYRVDVRVGTDGRRHAHRLRVRIAEHADPEARPLREAVIDAGALADDAWVAVEFPPLAESAGRELYVWVQADGASADDALTLWTYVHGWGEDVPGGLHIDHRPAPGSLTYRTFHREPSAATGTAPAAAGSSA